jgi:hypothetical protein
MSSITAMVLANALGKIEWNSTVNASNNDYDSNIVIGSYMVSLNVSDLHASINNSANVTLIDIDCDFFNLFYASGFHTQASSLISAGSLVATQNNIGGNCTDSSICTNLACSGGNLTFTAQHFDGFGVQNTTPVPEFSTIALFAILGLVLGGFLVMRRR